MASYFIRIIFLILLKAVDFCTAETSFFSLVISLSEELQFFRDHNVISKFILMFYHCLSSCSRDIFFARVAAVQG